MYPQPQCARMGKRSPTKWWRGSHGHICPWRIGRRCGLAVSAWGLARAATRRAQCNHPQSGKRLPRAQGTVPSADGCGRKAGSAPRRSGNLQCTHADPPHNLGVRRVKTRIIYLNARLSRRCSAARKPAAYVPSALEGRCASAHQFQLSRFKARCPLETRCCDARTTSAFHDQAIPLKMHPTQNYCNLTA
jgi:hypothetical protein